MTGHAQFLQAHMVRFERPIAASPERLWNALTDVGRVPGWYGDGMIEPGVGGTVQLMGGHIRGVVTQWQPPRKLAYTWNVFAPGEPVSQFPESYLTLEIGDGLLTLTHLPVLDRFVTVNAMGWHTFLDMVDAAATGAKVEERAVYAKRNAERYGIDMSKLPTA